MKMPDKENKPSEKKQAPDKSEIVDKYKAIEKPEPTGLIMLERGNLFKKDEKKK